MKIIVHTVSHSCCPKDGVVETNILGLFKNEENARKCFETQKAEEMKYAKQYGWKIYADEKGYFEAGEDGNFNNHFSILHWYQEEMEIVSD